MIESFFLPKQTDFLHNYSDPIILLSGPPSCGKTSLLFQFAYNCALQSNGNVVFICNSHSLESNPPYLSEGIDPASHAFKRKQMKYVEDDKGIKKYFAEFHLHDIFPVAVIVDDFGDLFDERKLWHRRTRTAKYSIALLYLFMEGITEEREQ